MGQKLPRITAIELLRALKRDGWQQIRQSGSHVTLAHPTKRGHVTIPKHASVILKLKTLAAILDQAGLTVNELRELL